MENRIKKCLLDQCADRISMARLRSNQLRLRHRFLLTDGITVWTRGCRYEARASHERYVPVAVAGNRRGGHLSVLGMKVALSSAEPARVHRRVSGIDTSDAPRRSGYARGRQRTDLRENDRKPGSRKRLRTDGLPTLIHPTIMSAARPCRMLPGRSSSTLRFAQRFSYKWDKFIRKVR